jgi:hypothetical protein
MGENIITIIFGVIFTIWGSFLIYIAIKNILLFRKAKSIPSVMGTIESTTITTVKGSADDGNTYYPEVKYKYVVDGVLYESEGIDFIGQSWPSREKAQSIINKYPRYSQVRVYYKPENPKSSSLKYRLNLTIILWAIFEPILLFCGIGFLLGSFGIISWNS